MRLSQLLLDMDYTVLQGEQEREISTLVYDSRKVEQDSVFVCISGQCATDMILHRKLPQKALRC